jgi:hypothetical protein
MLPQCERRNNDQQCTERAHDGRTRRQIPPVRKKQSGNAADKRYEPADEETIRGSLRESIWFPMCCISSLVARLGPAAMIERNWLCEIS